MRRYAFPKIGALPVSTIDTPLVLKVLEQKDHEDYPGQKLWEAIPETASRVRNRIENVLDWATARGYRSGDNPARWRGHLAHMLPKPTKLATVQHHAALPYNEVAQFMSELRQRQGAGARALEFLLLTSG
jgi:hypothetical protein